MTNAASRLPLLLSVAATALQLDISTKSVRRLIARGVLPIHRIGRQIRIAESDLLAYLHGHRK